MASSQATTLSHSDSVAKLSDEGYLIFKLLGYRESDFTTITTNLTAHFDGKLSLKLPEGDVRHHI